MAGIAHIYTHIYNILFFFFWLPSSSVRLKGGCLKSCRWCDGNTVRFPPSGRRRRRRYNKRRVSLTVISTARVEETFFALGYLSFPPLFFGVLLCSPRRRRRKRSMYCRMSMVTLIDRTFRVMSFSYKHQDFSNNQLK